MSLSFSGSLANACTLLENGGSSAQSSQRRQAMLQVRASTCDLSEACSQIPEAVGRRSLALATAAALCLPLVAPRSARALLDEDDDVELLERVKSVRKERIVKQKEEALTPEGEAFQSAVSELRAVGQALDAGDYTSASQAAADVFALAAPGGAVDAAAKKLKAKTDLIVSFRSGVKDLQAALSAEDDLSAKKAFVASAYALQELSGVTGLSPALVGL